MASTALTGKTGTKLTFVLLLRRFYETLDHRIPWSKGGTTSLNNLFSICHEHNQWKGDQDYETWIYKNSLLRKTRTD